MSRRLLLVLAVGALLPGCAGVRLFSDPELKHATGLRYYTAKPYLLVARTGEKSAPVSIPIVSLPDLEHPTYAEPRSGLGTSKTSITLKDGYLTVFGAETDAKVPETLSAAGSLLTAAAGALDKVRNRAASPGEGEPPTFELYEIRQEAGKTWLVPVVVPETTAHPGR